MELTKRLICCALFVWGSLLAKQPDSAESWTWLYKKSFNDQELKLDNNHDILTFDKMNVPSFTQLVLSWNAVRPEQGHFAFWAQAHDVASQEWGSWHKMMEWGANIQRSFLSADCFYSKCSHVRLEMKDYADGFRIKVQAHNGAHLTDLKAVFVSLADFTKFKPESPKSYNNDLLPSLIINNVPRHSQFKLAHPRNAGLCSPTSCTMLVSYLLREPVDPVEFAEKSFDKGLNAYGSWPFNIAHAYERCKGTMLFTMARLQGFNVLYQRLQQGIPVVVSVRGPLIGAPKAYEHGHLLVVIGWDAQRQTVICQDPAFGNNQDVLHEYPLGSFLEAWERSYRLAYIAEPICSNNEHNQ